jgi:hypothetical protein
MPILEAMEAEVFVLEIDGGALAEGQAATVVVEARPGTEYAGTVKRVDKLAKPRRNGVPVQYFAVMLTLDRTDPAVMKPGQRVRATLVIDESDAVVVPRQAVFDHEGQQVVYRRDGDRFEPVPVTLGAATAGRIVIESGLQAGDRVALRDPTRAAPSDGDSDSKEPTNGATAP